MDEHESEQDAAVRWERYPLVAATARARAFVLRLHRLARSPKTVDAYARNLDRYLACFTDASNERWLEADEGEILAALEALRRGHRFGGAHRPQRHLPDNVVPLSGARLTDATIAQYVVALRQFYDYLIRTRRRRGGVNPVLRGHRGDARSKPARGLLATAGRLPWIARPRSGSGSSSRSSRGRARATGP